MLFLPDDPLVLLRTLLAAVFGYAALVALVRLSGKRTLSQMNAFDLIVTVALGSTLASVITSNSVSIVQGVLALGLLVALQFAITWTSVRSGRVARLMKSEPRALVYHGHLLPQALRAERVLEVEIRAVLRAHGHPGVDRVDLVVLETDGTFSVVETLPRDPEVLESVRLPDQPAGRPSPDA